MATTGSVPTAPGRVGRRPVTSRADLERLGLGLFAVRGFDETTVDDIAAAAGIGRRTFFRYFASKNDVVWGDFDRELERMRRWLAESAADLPLMAAVHRAVLTFNTIDAAEIPWHRRRMELILRVPALQAHSTLRYADWRAVVGEFAARRLGVPVGALLPQLIGYAALGAAIAAYEQWLRREDSDLLGLLDEAMSALAAGFSRHSQPVAFQQA